MIPPAAYPKNPIAQPMINITAIMYNKLPMVVCFTLCFQCFLFKKGKTYAPVPQKRIRGKAWRSGSLNVVEADTQNSNVDGKRT
jgi:hypothetical protein